MKKADYLVVGAGFFGATFAHKMAKAGKKVIIIDKNDFVAGHVHTTNVKGINVHDFGAHIFHTNNEEVWDFVNQFASFNNFVNSPIAVFHDEIYNLPFNMNTFSKMWNTRDVEKVKSIIEKQSQELGGKTPRNLEEKAISLVGREIYEKLIKEYTEKQWNRKATELPTSIISRLPVRLTFNNNYFNDIHQGIPTNGYTEIIEKMLDDENIEVILNANYLDDREKYNAMADRVIYTGPIDEYFDYKLGPLEYRSLEFKTEFKAGVNNFQGNAVVNYTSHDVPYTRIIEHKFFDTANKEDDKDYTIITYEYSVDWKKGDEPYYPVNDDKNTKLYKEYRKLAKEIKNIEFAGRLGSYRYFNMDQTIHYALELAKELLSKEK